MLQCIASCKDSFRSRLWYLFKGAARECFRSTSWQAATSSLQPTVLVVVAGYRSCCRRRDMRFLVLATTLCTPSCAVEENIELRQVVVDECGTSPEPEATFLHSFAQRRSVSCRSSGHVIPFAESSSCQPRQTLCPLTLSKTVQRVAVSSARTWENEGQW